MIQARYRQGHTDRRNNRPHDLVFLTMLLSLLLYLTLPSPISFVDITSFTSASLMPAFPSAARQASDTPLQELPCHSSAQKAFL